MQGEAKIGPRWEWRTFDASLNTIEGRIAAALEHVAPHTSAEIYLLRLGGPQNAKIPDGILDVKRLQKVDINGLELWEPVLKAKFPLSQNDVAVAFLEWQLPLPRLGRKTYTIDQFTNELIAAQVASSRCTRHKSALAFQLRWLHSGICPPVRRFVMSGKLFARARTYRPYCRGAKRSGPQKSVKYQLPLALKRALGLEGDIRNFNQQGAARA
jgi:hypothetical protein